MRWLGAPGVAKGRRENARWAPVPRPPFFSTGRTLAAKRLPRTRAFRLPARPRLQVAAPLLTYGVPATTERMAGISSSNALLFRT